jgi:hypothetical protein
MMFVTCIRAVVLSNHDCNTDLATNVLHSACEPLVENEEIIGVVKLRFRKIFSVSGTIINISNGKLCMCASLLSFLCLTV